jgi:hypothetical protein
MKAPLAFVTALTLSACASSQPIAGGSVADGASTALALSQGGVEANPIIAGICPPDPIATAACAIGLNAIVADVLIRSGIPEATVRHRQNVIGYGAACNNLLVVAGVAFPASLIGFGACAWGYHEWSKD